jgi:uncharacterized tellurite resistance protein B-like protein
MNTNNIISVQLKSHFLRLYQMALTDDDFDVLELQMMYHLAEEKGIPKDELDKLFFNPVNTKLSIPEDLNTRIEYLYDLTKIMWADGVITADEINTLKKYCKIFDFLEENIEALANYLIDCVKAGTTKEEIIIQLNS